MASPISIAPSDHGGADSPPSPRIQRNYYGSRPPSPSLFGRINLEKVNERLRQRTQSLEPPEIQARKAYDELVDVGGVPTREWADCRLEDLSESQRGRDDGERHIAEFYHRELWFWEDQMKLWRRFGKRRALDGESDLRGLSPIDAVTAFVAYLRGHLERDVQYRAKPGREEYPRFGDLCQQRSFINKVVDLLPGVENLHRRLRSEAGDESALDNPELTVEEVNKEYNIPPWYVSDESLWVHRQASITPRNGPPPDPPRWELIHPESGREEEEEEEQEEEWPPKRSSTSPKPGLDNEPQTSSQMAATPSQNADATLSPEPASITTRRSEPKPDNTPATPTRKGATPPASAGRAKAAEEKTQRAKTKTAKTRTNGGVVKRKRKVVPRGAAAAANDASGARRSAKIAAEASVKLGECQ